MAVEHALLYSTLPPLLPHSRIILNVYATAALAVAVAVRWCGGSIRNNNKKNTLPPAAQSKEQSRVKHSHAFSTHTDTDTKCDNAKL